MANGYTDIPIFRKGQPVTEKKKIRGCAYLKRSGEKKRTFAGKGLSREFLFKERMKWNIRKVMSSRESISILVD